MPSVRFGAEAALSFALRSNANVRALVRTTAGIEQLAADELQAAGHQLAVEEQRQKIGSLESETP